MFCRNCGKEIADNVRFCMHCGQPCGNEKIESSESVASELPHTTSGNGIPCPACGSTNTEPLVHTTTQTQAGGYSCLGGICGGLLFGPAGLLIGLCGRSASARTSTQTRWICKSCGLEFPNKQDVQKVKRVGMAVAVPSCRIAYICVLLAIFICILEQLGISWNLGGVVSLLFLLGFSAILICLLFWIVAREKSPYSLDVLLPNGEAMEWMQKYKAVKVGLIVWFPFTIALTLITLIFFTTFF